MNNADVLAIANAIRAKEVKEARQGLMVGQHAVDTTIRIKGTLTVGADYERTPTVSIPLKETMAFLIRRMGITREAAKKALVAAMQDAIKETGAGEGSILQEHPEIAEAMEHVEAVTASLPKVPVKGPVTAKLTVEVLNG